MKDNKHQMIAALDIGSTKVVVAIATYHDGEVEVIGVGKAENRGVRQGQIVNMAETQKAIQEAKEEAELMAGVKLHSVYLAVGGHGVQAISSRGLIPVSGKDITKTDLEKVLDVAKAVHLPQESRILHALAQSYIVDGQHGIDSPVGMQGVRLEVDAQLVTVSEKNLSNFINCVEKSGLTVKQVVLDQYASTLATVEKDEQDLGVAVVEMGGGTCEVVVYREGCISHIATIPVGGLNFTQDVAVGLKTPLASAETIKKKYGTALVDMVGVDETIDVEALGERKHRNISRVDLSRILEARAEETLSLIFQKLSEWDVLKDLGAGVIITGGGSLLQGIVELAEFTFDVPVRRGVPKNVIGMREAYNSPIFSTAIGTLLFGCEQEHKDSPRLARTVAKTTNGAWDRIKNFMNKALSI
ncbi:MAG: cell division protein FtsA [Bdellovibrionales bacterium]|nr:cell division protein FtsA [Bdellovibrionales bacterium]